MYYIITLLSFSDCKGAVGMIVTSDFEEKKPNILPFEKGPGILITRKDFQTFQRPCYMNDLGDKCENK